MGLQPGLALVFVQRGQGDGQVGGRQQRGGFFWPLGQLEPGAGEQVAKAGVFPLARVVKTVEIKVPDGQARRFVRLDHRIGRAFDPALHAQRPEQVAHQRGLARAQVAVQGDEGIAQRWQCGQLLGKGLGGGFVRPKQGAGRGAGQSARRQGQGAFYNRRVVWCSSQLVPQIRQWARELGFSQIGVAGVDLSDAEPGLLAWLEAGFHGSMGYMAAHGLKRARPAELVPGTVSVITARMDYLPRSTPEGWQALEWQRLQRPGEAIVSMYARGRDYHKVLRSRLQKLAERIAAEIGPFGHRAFTDSAPVLEAELATRSGLGWRGKHTLVLHREAGSMGFLGEILVDLPLELTEPVSPHCGQCTACLDACPTQAIVAPYRLDARRCISYLTIEHDGEIPLALRPLLGNRIYGCDDCQLACPWNKFAQRSPLADFDPREGLAGAQLAHLFAWDEATFLRRTEGSPIRRIGHVRWLRNIAVALGNALRATGDPALRATVRAALQSRQDDPHPLVQTHVFWALAQDPSESKNHGQNGL